MSTTITGPTTVRPADPGEEARRSRIVLVILVAFQLMVATDLTVANIALPGIQASLGLSTVNLAWVINAYTLAFGGLLLLGGRVGDVFGRKRSFVAGVVLFTVASLAAGMATSAAWLLAARVAQGIGSAVAASNALALVASNFPEGTARNRAMGVYAASGALGASVGLILGGILTDWASWRWVLWINVPVGVVIAAVTDRFVRDGDRQVGHLDIAGAISSTLGVSALVYGFIRAAADGWRDEWTLASMGAAAVLLGGFVLVERRAGDPLTPLRLFGHRDRNIAYLIMMLLVTTIFGAFFFLSQFLQEVSGYSPLQAGLAFMPMTAAVMALSGPASKLMEQVGPRPLIVGGTSLVVIGAFWISQMTVDTGYWTGLLGPLLLFGIGMAGNIGPLTVLAMGDVDSRDTGAASGLLQVMQQFGISIGLAVLVTIYGAGGRSSVDAAAGDAVSPVHEAMAEGIGTAYILAGFLTVAALGLALLLRRRA